MALSCREVVELVTAYLDGGLDEATTAAVREHLQLCDGCEYYFEQIRRVAVDLGALPVDTLPEQTRDQLTAAFRDFHPGRG